MGSSWRPTHPDPTTTAAVTSSHAASGSASAAATEFFTTAARSVVMRGPDGSLTAARGAVRRDDGNRNRAILLRRSMWIVRGVDRPPSAHLTGYSASEEMASRR
jgi:hypothetical protein